MSGGADRWIRWTMTGCVGLLALIAGSVSYLHRHLLVESHGQPGRVAASTTLLTDSLAGKRGRVDRALAVAAFRSVAPTMELMRPQLPRLAVFGCGALAAVLGVSPANGYGGGRSCGGVDSPAAHLVNKPGARKVPAISSAAWRLARLQARVAQEREHGRDTPVHLLLADQVQLGEDRVDVLLD
jgi:hypothetical protein